MQDAFHLQLGSPESPHNYLRLCYRYVAVSPRSEVYRLLTRNRQWSNSQEKHAKLSKLYCSILGTHSYPATIRHVQCLHSVKLFIFKA